MGLSLSPLQVFMAIPEFRFRRNYLERNSKVINASLKELSPTELVMIRSIVFPLDKSWPPGTHLPKEFSKAIDAILGHPKTVEYFSNSQVQISSKLAEWNGLAKLPKPEFARKMEGAGRPEGLTMRVIKLYGKSFFDLVEFCRLYEKMSVLKIMRETIVMMNKKKWTGIVTPKMCVFLLSGKTITESNNGKLRELEIE